jgi:hypothetical protein
VTEEIDEKAVGRAKKAWETMRSRSSGIKAKYTRRRKEGARKAASKVKGEQWKPEKTLCSARTPYRAQWGESSKTLCELPRYA